MSNSITIHGVRTSYRPGEAVSGTVEWRADPPPRAMVIKLFWVTSGAAPRQIGVVDSSTVERLNPSGTNHFEFCLPEGPWSFDGELVRLTWAIEAILLPSKQNTHVKFSLGAEDSPQQLPA